MPLIKEMYINENDQVYIELVYNQFTDKSIVVCVDDCGILKDKPQTVRLKNYTIRGTAIIARLNHSSGEGELQGLNLIQVTKVISELFNRR